MQTFVSSNNESNFKILLSGLFVFQWIYFVIFLCFSISHLEFCM